MSDFKHWDDCSGEERVERFRNAIRVVESMTPKYIEDHFRMDSWVEDTDCGTTACAGGACGFDPWFISQGFEMVKLDTPWVGWGFKGMNPEAFFGDHACDAIFVNNKFTNPDWSMSPAESHAEVLEAMKQFVEDLCG